MHTCTESVFCMLLLAGILMETAATLSRILVSYKIFPMIPVCQHHLTWCGGGDAGNSPVIGTLS